MILKGAQALVIDNKIENDIVLKTFTHKNGAMWSSFQPQTVLRLIQQDRGLYEILPSYPQKVYFDIDRTDLKVANGYYLNQIILPLISENFPRAEIAISGSATDAKTSYHIILSNYVLTNHDDKAHLKLLVQYFKTRDSGFDTNVYGRNQCFKLPNQSKPNKPVQVIIKYDNLEDHIVSSLF